MTLIEGVHAMDSQVWALRRLARQLSITETGEATHCRPYGVERWHELRWQDAEALEASLRRIAAAEGDGDGGAERGRFWDGPV